MGEPLKAWLSKQAVLNRGTVPKLVGGLYNIEISRDRR